MEINFFRGLIKERAFLRLRILISFVLAISTLSYLFTDYYSLSSVYGALVKQLGGLEAEAEGYVDNKGEPAEDKLRMTEKLIEEYNILNDIHISLGNLYNISSQDLTLVFKSFPVGVHIYNADISGAFMILSGYSVSAENMPAIVHNLEDTGIIRVENIEFIKAEPDEVLEYFEDNSLLYRFDIECHLLGGGVE